jgi:hypothetical protein
MVLGEAGWEDRISAALAQPNIQRIAVEIVLAMPGENPRLWNLVWELLPQWTDMVLVHSGKRMPESRVATLLGHPNTTVGREAAMAEWYSEPSGSIRPALMSAWRAAVVRGADHIPDAAWSLFPGLARDWLAARFNRQNAPLHPNDPTATEVFSRLTTDDRSQLLGQIPGDNFWASEIVPRLVGGDPSMYRQLLANKGLRRFHLNPLHGPPTSTWDCLAALALAAGFSSEEVVRASFGDYAMYEGNESDHWRPWRDGFELLETHRNESLRQVGRIGRRNAEERIERAMQAEQYEAVYGEG